MSTAAVFALQVAAVVVVAALVVAVVAAALRSRNAATSSAGGSAIAAAVHDVERALGAATLVTYEQAAAGRKASEQGEARCCAICLSEYAKGDELMRVVPACGHFFHAACGVDGWLRVRPTCPVCRGGLWPLPECPPMPPRTAVAVA
ncbi:hypothetical protein ACP70R_025092 [Stipagrostis hirtigluma subsp. patula]